MSKLKNIQKQLERKFLPHHHPDFLIIGAQKASTTTLFDYLNQHPRLAGSWPKEIHFFTRQINNGKDLTWYRKHFTSLKKNALYFEASPNYIFFESAAQEIKKAYPNMKLILLLRNPVDRAFSAWNMYNDFYNEGVIDKRLQKGEDNAANAMYKSLLEGRDRYLSFREAVAMELDLIKKGKPLGINFIRKGLYYDQIMTYLKYFNHDQLLVVGMKDLIKEPKKVVYQILDFLKVDNSTQWQPPALPVKNKRSYVAKLDEADRNVLAEFYREPNQKLIDFLGHPVNW